MSIRTVWEGPAWSTKILQRVCRVMYRPISYQNALLSFGSKLTSREKVSVQLGEEKIIHQI